MNIQFFTEDVSFGLQQEYGIPQWIQSIVEEHSFQIKELNYIFCSDDYLLKVNQDHLNHDYFTDIITFDNSDETSTIESDIFISIDRIRENAQEHNVSFQHELHRVMAHGVLHLLGFNDKTEEDQRTMREKENACLSLLDNQRST
ncbi:MAG: rRNA maturation RNase YbeY [Bacteroidota bacterium]